jgi:biotin carboxyl carrier protein
VSGETSYEVTVGDHVFDITLVANADGLLARLGDEEHTVAWQPRDAHAGTLRVDDTAVQVLLTAGPEATWVAADGYQAEVRIAEARTLRLAASLPLVSGASERTEVRAPMPGRVVSVRVAAGEPVERNGLVVVLEAMKMQNELRAPQAGRVAEVRVAEGATVERGALLLVLAPPIAE